jgi:hypothetical protein
VTNPTLLHYSRQRYQSKSSTHTQNQTYGTFFCFFFLFCFWGYVPPSPTLPTRTETNHIMFPYPSTLLGDWNEGSNQSLHLTSLRFRRPSFNLQAISLVIPPSDSSYSLSNNPLQPRAMSALNLWRPYKANQISATRAQGISFPFEDLYALSKTWLKLILRFQQGHGFNSRPGNWL